jgi:hypothetical protein
VRYGTGNKNDYFGVFCFRDFPPCHAGEQKGPPTGFYCQRKIKQMKKAELSVCFNGKGGPNGLFWILKIGPVKATNVIVRLAVEPGRTKGGQ